ncbi:MAG: glycosyltransferase [Rhodospirillales bacterium]|nr:glycosyltransferase [Rhodospirillales bacterium]
MTLSVVVPAHNAASTLAETLDSLLAQTRGDWHAIIVDDGSRDATRGVAQSYADRDKRFSLLTDEGAPEGVSAARNRGIAAASGRWLLFLDADDTIAPSFAARMLGALESRPEARVAYCGSRRITAAGRLGPPWISTAVAREPFETFARDCPIVIHGAVLERALVVEQGGFDAGLRTAEDMDFFQRMARTGAAFLPVSEVLAFYRMRGGSLSTDARAMLADTDLVIERAFAPDPRVVHPASRYAHGADPALGSRETAQGINALWCAALDIGQGGDGTGFVRPLPDHRDGLVEACRQTIVEGLMFGAQKLADELPHGDARLIGALRHLLDDLEAATQHKGLARQLEFVLEPEIFRPENPSGTLIADRTLFVRQDIARLQPIAAADGIDRIHVEFRNGRQVVGRSAAPALGSGLERRDVMQLALDSVSLATLVRSGGLLAQPVFWLQTGWRATRLGAAVALAKLRRRAVPVRSLRALAKAALAEAALATMGDAGTGERAVAALIAEGQAMARTAPPAAAKPVDEGAPGGGGRRAYWEHVYRTEDPWAYGSAYEQLKYQRTLALVPDGPIGRAMELACSEGRFTELLAPRVGHLIAADISQTALQRARQRCRAHGNVDYRRLDLLEDPLPDGLDLIVCSEVLYYLADRGALARVARRFAAALAPGGHLLSAHAFVLKDDPAHTGYDWNATFGARMIAETLSATPGLALERSLQNELYHVDLFRRLDAHEPAPAQHIEQTELGPPPEPDFARHVVWGGAVVQRAQVQARERTDRLPILLYHRIAENGPADLARYRQAPAAFAEQMRWLRRNGYHAVTSDDVARHLAAGRPFAGRPVLISFDDAYCDFHDAAWPILRTHDFTAEIFVVTDKVGGHADWDLASGPPAPLMDWPQIQSLAVAGVRFGSHMASHSHMADLSSREIVLEAARSRAALERALGEPCRSIAAPFGEGDERFVRIARQCGYASGFTTDPGHAALGQDPLRLPRIEVVGGWSIEAFIGAVQGV